jgi:hypothetical protein
MPRSRFSRRCVLASLGAAPVASVLAKAAVAGGSAQECGAPASDVPRTEHVLTAVLRVKFTSPPDAASGSAIIVGGEAEGALAGVVQPGSLEWTCDASRNVLQLAARFDLQASAGLRIHVADRATVVTPPKGYWEAPFPTTPELTVVDGSPAACREAVYLGRMDARQIQAGQLRLTVHRVL